MAMSTLSEKVVVHTIERHLATLRSLRSDALGAPSGLVVPPYRVIYVSEKDDWSSHM